MSNETQARLTPARFIRMSVLKMSQNGLAKAMKVSQPMVAKIERQPMVSLYHREKLRAVAHDRGVTIEDSWFLAVPLTRSAKKATI